MICSITCSLDKDACFNWEHSKYQWTAISISMQGLGPSDCGKNQHKWQVDVSSCTCDCTVFPLCTNIFLQWDYKYSRYRILWYQGIPRWDQEKKVGCPNHLSYPVGHVYSQERFILWSYKALSKVEIRILADRLMLL